MTPPDSDAHEVCGAGMRDARCRKLKYHDGAHDFDGEVPDNYPFSGPREYECTGTEDGKHLFNFPCTACGASPRDLVFVGKDLAQRILAALDMSDATLDANKIRAVAAELRERIPK